MKKTMLTVMMFLGVIIFTQSSYSLIPGNNDLTKKIIKTPECRMKEGLDGTKQTSKSSFCVFKEGNELTMVSVVKTNDGREDSSYIISQPVDDILVSKIQSEGFDVGLLKNNLYIFSTSDNVNGENFLSTEPVAGASHIANLLAEKEEIHHFSLSRSSILEIRKQNQIGKM